MRSVLQRPAHLHVAAELQPRRGWPITTHTSHILQPCHVPQADSKPRSIRTIPQTTAWNGGKSRASRPRRMRAERAAAGFGTPSAVGFANLWRRIRPTVALAAGARSLSLLLFQHPQAISPPTILLR